MYLKSLQLKGFRNLQSTQLIFPQTPDSLLVFVGPNGQGKTNTLEAIYLLAFSKSFHVVENHDLVGFLDDFCSIQGVLGGLEMDRILDVVILKNPPEKGLKVNGVFHKAVDFIGQLRVVFFSPDDLLMIQMEPRLRRRYLDLLLIQSDHDYLIQLMTYNALIRQRNALLRRIRDRKGPESDLEVWDDKLAEAGTLLIRKRLDMLQFMQEPLQTFYSTISHTSEKITVEYRSFVAASTLSGDVYRDALFKVRSRDIEWGNTSLGPHRDDVIFSREGRLLSDFGSRGEQRSLVLALKLTEIQLLATGGDTPILLLDDVFSELDEERQRYFFESTSGIQTFVTTTHVEFLNEVHRPQTLFNVQGGQISLR